MPNIEASDLQIEPLGKHHDRTAFSCGKEPLDRYLKAQASQDAKRRIAATFVLTIKDDKTVLGFYSLANFSIGLSDLPPSLATKLPRYPTIPATLLGRLAVHQERHGRRFGELLVVDAMRRTLFASLAIASYALVVDAMDAGAAKFYEKFDFKLLLNQPDDRWPKRYFLPLKTIQALGL